MNSAHNEPSNGVETEADQEEPEPSASKSQSLEPATYSVVQHPLRAEFVSNVSVYGNVVLGPQALNVGGVIVIGPTVSL